MNDGIIVKFDDGKCGFYPSSLLYATLQHCKQLDEAKVQW